MPAASTYALAPLAGGDSVLGVLANGAVKRAAVGTLQRIYWNSQTTGQPDYAITKAFFNVLNTCPGMGQTSFSLGTLASMSHSPGTGSGAGLVTYCPVIRFQKRGAGLIYINPASGVKINWLVDPNYEPNLAGDNSNVSPPFQLVYAGVDPNDSKETWDAL